MTETIVHSWDWCNMCGWMVVCGKCGNNCCNGGYGETADIGQLMSVASNEQKQRAYERALVRSPLLLDKAYGMM